MVQIMVSGTDPGLFTLDTSSVHIDNAKNVDNLECVCALQKKVFNFLLHL